MARPPAALRRSLARGAALTGLGLGAALAAHRMADDAAAALAREENRRDALTAAQPAASAPSIAAWEAIHRDLTRRKVIGPEHRVDWAEQLARLERKHRLEGLSYELEAQQQGVQDIRAVNGPYHLAASRMALQARVLHEGDLLRFLGDLDGSVSAILRVRACTLARDAEPGERLKAECSIDWVTVQEGA